MALRPPPRLLGMLNTIGLVGNVWGQWFFDLFKKAEELEDRANITYINKTVTADDLDSGITVKIKEAVDPTDQWKVREIFLSGTGTNFDGSGDKDLNIQDTSGTRVFTTIPAATLKSLAAARWGDTGTPFPSDSDDLFGATTAGEDILFKYSGGSTGYSFVGELTVTLLLEKVA